MPQKWTRRFIFLFFPIREWNNWNNESSYRYQLDLLCIHSNIDIFTVTIPEPEECTPPSLGVLSVMVGAPYHQVLEFNNQERLARCTGPPALFDPSQKGNWENVRNETMNRRSFQFKSEAFEPLPVVSGGGALYLSSIVPSTARICIRADIDESSFFAMPSHDEGSGWTSHDRNQGPHSG